MDVTELLLRGLLAVTKIDSLEIIEVLAFPAADGAFRRNRQGDYAMFVPLCDLGLDKVIGHSERLPLWRHVFRLNLTGDDIDDFRIKLLPRPAFCIMEREKSAYVAAG